MNATTHVKRAARLRGHAPVPVEPVFGFPSEPWKLCGMRRFEWFRSPNRAAMLSHMLLAQILNVAALKDDLPFGVRYPERENDPLVLYRRPGVGDVRKNRVWLSFFAWLDSVESAPLRQQIERQRAEVRALIEARNVRNAVALPSLPYGHLLGPSATPKGGFGPAGGGNRSGRARRSSHHRGDVRQLGGAVVDYSELKHGFQTLDGKPFELDAEVAKQVRAFDSEKRNFRRIKARGKKTPRGRPRLSADKDRRVRELRAAGWGVKRIAKTLGIGVSAVQRIKRGTEIRPS